MAAAGGHGLASAFPDRIAIGNGKHVPYVEGRDPDRIRPAAGGPALSWN